ncbi:MAG: preprotein translocase subunit SecA, partial [Bacteroidota bacterium]
MFGFLKRLFGTKAERNIKRLKPYVKKINTLYATLAKLSHDELRAETDKLRAFLASKTDTITQEITALQTQVADTGELREKLKLNEKISQLEEKQARITERALHEMLPQAFAIVKETARRFKENTTITVKANDFDKKIA